MTIITRERITEVARKAEFHCKAVHIHVIFITPCGDVLGNIKT